MSVTLDPADALCAIQHHEVYTHPPTYDIPFTVLVCRSEGCASRQLVALTDFVAACQAALGALWCPCPSPAVCNCLAEPLRVRQEKVVLRAVDARRFLLRGTFPLAADCAEAERVLGGRG